MKRPKPAILRNLYMAFPTVDAPRVCSRDRVPGYERLSFVVHLNSNTHAVR